MHKGLVVEAQKYFTVGGSGGSTEVSTVAHLVEFGNTWFHAEKLQAEKFK